MAAVYLHPPHLICTHCSWKKKKKTISSAVVRATLGGDDDPFSIQVAAINRASLRFQETLAPEPLFHDPYAGCFIDPEVQKKMKKNSLPTTSTSHYCLATKFIDDKLFSVVNHVDGVRQIVLLTDGMDTRPYRLKWPNSSIIFDISPERIFRTAAQNLKGVGAKIPKSCLLVHVPSESSDIQEILCRKGFNGNRPSVWAMQGLPMMTLASFIDVLVTVSSLATKGCFFVGELPAWLAETEIVIKPDTRRWIDRIFMSNGFRVEVISYDEVVKDIRRNPPSGDCKYILFVAEQLRLSDVQPDTRRWIDRIFMSNGFRVEVISYDEVVKDIRRNPPSGDCKYILFVAEQLRLSDVQ
ncbi:S-adenosyl-l-methionine-dependent methyltransferases superfamily protein, partial [Thalictrum thalictroides]